jgi:drug/metabolite transporter (DMT)-like permease
MKAWLFIFFAGFIAASLGLCTKYLTTRGVAAVICAAVPFALSAAIAVVFHPRNVHTPWREGLAMGAVNAGVPAMLFNVGYSQLPASLVTLTLALAPIFTAITAHFAFRDDRFTAAKLAGLALSFGGVVFLAGLPAGSGSRSTLAFFTTIAGAAVAGASLVWVRRMATRHEPMTVLAPMQVGAAAVTVIAASFLGHPVWNPGADTLELGLLGVMGAGTILTFLCSLKASELAPASKVGLMGYLVPLVGVAGGVIIFNETLTSNLLLGGLLILAGVTLVGRANRSVTVGSPV